MVAIHSGVPAIPDGDAVVGAGRARDRTAISSRSARSSPARTSPRWSRAFERVAATDPTIRLVLAGPPGWDSAHVQSAVDSIRARDRIVQLGFVSDADRADLLAGATVFAYPSVYEGFGFPPLEAMQCGVPVVAGAAGALPEVLGDAAALVDPMDVDGLGDAITRAGRSRRRRSGRADRARSRPGDPLRLGRHRRAHGRRCTGVSGEGRAARRPTPPTGSRRHRTVRRAPGAATCRPPTSTSCASAPVSPSDRVQSLIGTYVNLGWPRGPLRYELWHRFRRPKVRLAVDLVHAPSLAIPATDLPLVVTVHDVAFLREPSAFTRRGLEFHRRGLKIAHREAAVIVTASRFARDELVSVGFERDRIHLAPHGVEVRTPEANDQIDRACRRGRAAAAVRAGGGHGRAAQGPRRPGAGLQGRAHAPARTCRSRSSARRVGSRSPGIEGPGIRRLGTVDERTLDALYRRGTPVRDAVAVRGLRAPRARGDGAGLSRGREQRDEPARGRRRRRDARAGRRRRIPRPRPGGGRAAITRCAPRMAELGRARAAGFTWQGSAHAHAAAYAAAIDAS